MADQKKIIGGLGKISKRLLRDRDEPLSKMDEVLSSKQAPMTTPSGTGLPLMPRDQGMYTLREQKDLPRMPKVDAARASGKSPKYTERMQDLLDSPTARKKVDKLINQGKDLNMTQWYGTEPLRQVAMDAGRTPEQFESLMAQLSSASQRNPVDKQNQMGSYLYHLSQTGQLPENSLLLTNKLKKALKEDPSLAEGRTLVELPAGYGSLAQGDIFNRAVMIGQGDIAGALPPNKKLGTFYENLLGNLKPVTVDVNAVRGPIIERGDPRWLTSKLVEKDEEGRIINSYKPREMFDSGEMTMREAKQRPGFWEAAPSGSEYAGFEDLWQRGAKRHGVEPAEAQALGWYGSADVTALKTKPELYIDNLERLIKRTAEQTGQSPKKVMKDFVTGEGFLRKDGGAVDIDAADARLAAAMQARMSNGMADGGEVNIKDSDARLQAAINARMGMAEGGEAGFKKIEFMQAGGVAKGAAKGFKKLFADRDVLPLKESKIIQPPSVIIPSKVSNVKEAIRQSKGEYGAKRVERAADEIPNLEKMYQEEALRRAFSGDSARGLMTINPADFEKYATPIPMDIAKSKRYFTDIDKNKELNMRDVFRDSNLTDSEWMALDNREKALLAHQYMRKYNQEEMGHEQYLKHLAGIDDGFDEVPFLEINKQEQGLPLMPFISGHEGRHRNRALAGRGEEKNLIQLLPRAELRESFPRRSQEEYIEALKKELEMTGNMVRPERYFDNMLQKDIKRKPVELPDLYAEGGGAFKTLQFQEPQRFDGGGIAVPEEGGGYSPKSFFDSKKWSDIKKNAAELYDEGKQTLASDYERLKSSPRARAQLAKIAAAQLAGGVPDLAHLAVDLVVDPLKSVTVDKLLTKPRPRSVMEEPLKPNEKQERVPMFGSLSEALKTEDGLPIGGSEHMIKRAQDAGLMHTGRFSPLTEIPAAILGGAGVAKAGKGVVKGYDKLTGANSGKLSSLQPEAMTAPAGKPQGVTYATKQEGPFYRVSPTSLDVSGAKSRGLREADELQSQAPVGGSTGQAGSEVPLRISDEEVARLVANPETNQPLQIAQRFTKETQGTDFAIPEIPESTLAKQSAIGRAHQLAVDGSPEYKSAVFDAYAKQMPDLLEQVGAKDYDDLMAKAYRQLAKETDEQFKQLPYNFSYHRAGEGDYLGGSKDMMADVHGNKHLYVFQGGDPHDFLNRVDKASGLNENEKFRAVHDLLGHAIYGNQFGPKGEEVAWAIHQQMYSPLARLAMTAETRGQNSLVNYSPLNVSLKSNIAKLEDLEVEALRRKDTALVNEIRAAKRQEFANNFQFAPQKAVLLPPEFLDPKFTGGLPDYLSAANRPAKGTESQSVLTHFSNDPNLQMLDPKRYSTGIKGAEAERLNNYLGGVKDRSYVYLGEPGTVSPESGLGINRYRAESSNLYDITKDPLGFRSLARESNRTPFTAKYNAGITHPLQEANDYERLVKEYGYEGMINPNAGKPMGIMFKPTPVQPRKRGGLTQLK